MKNTPTWGVAALADEPLPLVKAFVAHHLAEGAEDIQLFLDRPDRAVEAALTEIDRVRLHDCSTPGFWEPHESRPKRLAIRLRHTAKRAMRRTRADWMLFCDLDEYVSDGAALSRELASLDDVVEELNLPVRERFQPGGLTIRRHIFQGAFRAPLPEPMKSTNVSGKEQSPYLQRGLTGHTFGKTLYRKDMRGRPGVHEGDAPEDATAEEVKRRVKVSETVRLYHFDGLTPLNWALKLRRKVVASAPKAGRTRHKSRLAQIRFATERDTVACMALYRRLTRLDRRALAELDRLGVVDRTAFDPRPAVRRFFPGTSMSDFVPRRYDHLLSDRFSDVIAADERPLRRRDRILRVLPLRRLRA